MANTTGIGIVIFPLLESYGGSGSAGDVTFPLLVAEGYGAGEGALILPLLEALGAGTTLSAIGAMTFPTLVALGSGTPGGIGNGDVVFPLLSTHGQGYSQTIGVGSLKFPHIVSHGIGADGQVYLPTTGIGSLKFPLLISHGVGLQSTILLSTQGIGALKFPLLVSGGVGLAGTIGIGSLTLPLISVSGSELCDSRGSGTLIFPLIEAYGYGIDVPITFIRSAIVMNLFNHAVSEYVNLPFNSIVEFNGVLIGANENGVFLLGGDNDLGVDIESEVMGGLIDLSDKAVKVPLEAWISGRYTQGGLDLKLEVDEDKDFEYPFLKFGRKEGRATIGGGIKGRFFKFGFKNKSSFNFDIQSLRILGDIIRRKTR